MKLTKYNAGKVILPIGCILLIALVLFKEGESFLSWWVDLQMFIVTILSDPLNVLLLICGGVILFGSALVWFGIDEKYREEEDE